MTPPPTRADPVPGEPGETRPLLFLHIPRTGGSTLKFMLQSSFGLARSLLDAQLFQTWYEDLSRFAFIEGHVSAGFFARSFGPDWHANAITMLREPVERTVSQARHIRARGKDTPALPEVVHDPDAVFERFPRLVNAQTKHLSRVLTDEIAGADALAEAKQNLDRMAFGLTEAYDRSVALFVERFRLDIPRFDVANDSRGAHDEDLQSVAFRAAARRHNDMDQQLYEHAAALLGSRVASYTQTLLGLAADDATLTSGLRFRRHAIEDHVRLPAEPVSSRLSGWVLVDGRAADAVLVRVGDEVTPLVARVERDDAGRRTRDLHNRHAGILGNVTIPPEATVVELIAIDRTRKLRATRTIEIARVARRPFFERSVAAVKSRTTKRRRR